MKNIAIYPAFDALYYSCYVQGIVECFGRSNVAFSYRGFPRVSSDFLAFTIEGDPPVRVAIDAYDGSTIADTSALEWCDVYGKVNLIWSLIPHQWLPKCLAIGPSFPVRLWSLTQSLAMALKNYRPNARIKSVHEHFANYVRQYRDRLPLRDFIPGAAKENYIFFSSTIWGEDEAPETNQRRASFMEACKSLEGVTFEGGFSPPASLNAANRYKEHLAPKRYPLTEWLEKT
jgi:hypothetical protein